MGLARFQKKWTGIFGSVNESRIKAQKVRMYRRYSGLEGSTCLGTATHYCQRICEMLYVYAMYIS